MNKIDFIYLKLCQKYSNSIFMKKEIKNHLDMYPNKDNIWEYQQDLGISFGPVEFWRFDSDKMIKIDLKKEQENGTFEN